jgi:hypothetical protein
LHGAGGRHEQRHAGRRSKHPQGPPTRFAAGQGRRGEAGEERELRLARQEREREREHPTDQRPPLSAPREAERREPGPGQPGERAELVVQVHEGHAEPAGCERGRRQHGRAPAPAQLARERHGPEARESEVDRSAERERPGQRDEREDEVSRVEHLRLKRCEEGRATERPRIPPGDLARAERARVHRLHRQEEIQEIALEWEF